MLHHVLLNAKNIRQVITLSNVPLYILQNWRKELESMMHMERLFLSNSRLELSGSSRRGKQVGEVQHTEKQVLP